MTIPTMTEANNTHAPTVLLGMNQYPIPPRIVEKMSEIMTRRGVGPVMINSTMNAMKSSKSASRKIEDLILYEEDPHFALRRRLLPKIIEAIVARNAAMRLSLDLVFR